MATPNHFPSPELEVYLIKYTHNIALFECIICQNKACTLRIYRHYASFFQIALSALVTMPVIFIPSLR